MSDLVFCGKEEEDLLLQPAVASYTPYKRESTSVVVQQLLSNKAILECIPQDESAAQTSDLDLSVLGCETPTTGKICVANVDSTFGGFLHGPSPH
jgi:hypothetical protein